MPCRQIFTGLLLIISAYMLLLHHSNCISGVSAATSGFDNAHRVRTRPAVRLSPRPNSQYAKIRAENIGDFIVDDDDLFELSKRQTADDYGHLRFGKRGEEPFDDYGHMRFGRSKSD